MKACTGRAPEVLPPWANIFVGFLDWQCSNLTVQRGSAEVLEKKDEYGNLITNRVIAIGTFKTTSRRPHLFQNLTDSIKSRCVKLLSHLWYTLRHFFQEVVRKGAVCYNHNSSSFFSSHPLRSHALCSKNIIKIGRARPISFGWVPLSMSHLPFFCKFFNWTKRSWDFD